MTDRESWRPRPPVDPSGIEAPHDVLAADEFGIGTADRRLPPDPHRFEPPHDILAAEEFALPAAGRRGDVESAAARDRRSLAPLVLDTAPDVFHLDDEDKAVVVDPDGAPLDDVIEAARNCPVSAIFVAGEDGDLYP